MSTAALSSHPLSARSRTPATSRSSSSALPQRAPALWQRCMEQRWSALGIALAAWGAMTALSTGLAGSPAANDWRWLARLAYAAMQWSSIVAAPGFARRHLNRDHRWRATLAEALFPVYIVHQTLIIGFAMALAPLHWRPGIEGPALVVLTFAASFAAYLLARRVPALRTVFGLNPLPAQRGRQTGSWFSTNSSIGGGPHT